MNLNDLLKAHDVDPATVLVMRHRPREPLLRKALPWLAAEKPELFNAYQQTQGDKVESAMMRAHYVAAFLAHGGGRGLFAGIYKIASHRPVTHKQYWQIPAYAEMRAKYQMVGFTGKDRTTCLWFDLELQDIYSQWQGRLVVDWPPPERSWWRWASRNIIPVNAVLEDSALIAPMKEWDKLVVSWDELKVMPAAWRNALSHWRGVYFVFDQSSGRGYIGSAYGRENLLGRWQEYGNSGHGNNRLLRQLDPANFRFSILQRVSPDMPADEVLRIEATWKDRLHTRAPSGLNDN